MKLLSTQLYNIIKYRKHRTTINYLDYERIFGYDFLTYSKSFDDVLNFLTTNKEKNIKFIRYLSECISKDNFDCEKPLSGIDRHKVVFMSYRLNEIDDYIITSEKRLLEFFKTKSLEEFYDLPITYLGFNTFVNEKLFSLNIFNIKQLFYMEAFKDKIDKSIGDIVFSKANSIRYKLYNIKPYYQNDMPISLLIDTDYKKYDNLRKNGVYTLKDLTRYNKLNKIRKLEMK